MNDCSNFQSLTLQEEDMTNNSVEKEKKKKSNSKKERGKLFEKLLSRGNPLLTTNKSNEGGKSKRNPILGQSFPSTLL